MSNLIALKAELGVARERIVSVLTTQYASESCPFVWTLPRLMAELLAPEALHSGVRIQVIPVRFGLHLVEHVVDEVTSLLILTVLHSFIITFFTINWLRFIGVSPEVLVSLKSAAWHDQIRVTLNVVRSDVIA